MNAELQAYDDAWRNTDKAKRNDVCQALADAYVQTHPDLAVRFGGLTIPECVALLEVARDAGDEERRVELDIWINAAFEYQNIGGVIDTSGQARELPFVNVAGDRRKSGGK